jgi:NitT/TauT family transport system substrate-binding protein
VDSGDALKNGIGAMSDDRMAEFFGKMVHANVTPRDLDYRKAYTLRFINKGVGLNLRPNK